MDAQIIADYVATHDCEPWTPLPAELEELRELMRLYADVTAVAASVGQRQEALRTAMARKLLAEIATTLKEFARRVLKTARAHARQHATLARPVECLETIQGIGPVTALVLTAELPRNHAARSVAGWAGVTPRHFESGESVHRPSFANKAAIMCATLFIGQPSRP